MKLCQKIILAIILFFTCVISFKAQITYLESKLSYHTQDFNATEKSIDDTNLLKIKFNDSLNGVIMSVNFVYTTNDGGKTWIKSNFQQKSDFWNNEIFFLNKELGWLIVEKKTNYSNSDKAENYLFKTTDGGKNWQLSSNFQSVLITGMSFTTQNNGWVIGNRYVMNPTEESFPVIFFTKNGGSSWIDLSSQINFKQFDTLDSISVQSEQSVLLFTIDGQITNLSNDGRKLSSIQIRRSDEFDYGISAGGKINNSYWFLGGKNSIEGTYTILGHQKRNKSWIGFSLDNLFIEDIAVSSKNEVYACGVKPKSLNIINKSGIIMKTSNLGKDWEIIYQPDSIKRFVSIAINQDGTIWAIGDNELIIQLKPKKESKIQTTESKSQ